MTDPRWFESPGDELEDDEYPDEPLDDDGAETIPCPQCGAEIYEDSVRCPVCGEYVPSGSSSLWSGRSPWWILLGLLGIAAVIWALVGLGP